MLNSLFTLILGNGYMNLASYAANSEGSAPPSADGDVDHHTPPGSSNTSNHDSRENSASNHDLRVCKYTVQ